MRNCFGPSEKHRLSSWWPKQGNNATGQEYNGYADSSHSNSAARHANQNRRAIREVFKKNDVAGFRYVASSNPVRAATSPRLFSVKIPATDSSALFPMWGSRRALALCENASVAQNDGPWQDGMTCTVIPIVLRALPCCCTVIAHGCADWERACSLRIIRRVVVQDGVHSGKRPPVKCCTERTGQ